MERRKHDKITPKMWKKKYVFSEWDVCIKKNCRYIQHYNEFKTTPAVLFEKLNFKQGSLIKD